VNSGNWLLNDPFTRGHCPQNAKSVGGMNFKFFTVAAQGGWVCFQMLMDGFFVVITDSFHTFLLGQVSHYIEQKNNISGHKINHISTIKKV
jgi:multisubunit Na+/H+ antiporter MnhG subunit